MKKLMTLFAAGLLLAACSNDDNVIDNGPVADGSVQFGVTMTQLDQTRATPGNAVGIIDTEALLAKKEGFGVFGLYTGASVYENTTVTPDFMFNQQVKGKLDGTDYVWSYDPVKYWPNTGKTTFFAYAPYVDHTKIDFEKPELTNCIAGFSNPYDEGDPWLIYVLSPDPFKKFGKGGQTDLLIGYNADDANNPWYNLEKPAVDKEVKFNFKHALGLIGDRIRLQLTDELQTQLNADHSAKVFVDHIVLNYKNLTRKAKLVLNSKQGDPNWKPIVSGEVTTNRTVVVTKANIQAALAEAVPVEGGDFDQTYYNANSGINSTNASTSGDGLVLLTGKGLLYIPYIVAPVPQELEVELYYQVLAQGMEAYNGVAKSTINLAEGTSGREDGKARDVVITLGKNLSYDKIYKPQIGDFYYSDGTWGDKNVHDTGARPIGVVVYLGNDIGTYDPETGEKGFAEHGLVMGFKNTEHTFTDYGGSTKYNRWGFNIDTSLPNCDTYQKAYEDVNGEYNTSILYNLWTVNSAQEDNNYWAAWEVSKYETVGAGSKGKRGAWHIGTFGEWARIWDAVPRKLVQSLYDLGYSDSEPLIENAVKNGSIVDGMMFYPSNNGTVDHSPMETLEQSNYVKYNQFDGGYLQRNKLQNGIRYWTSTEVSNTNAISFNFHYVPEPNYNDAIQFFMDGAKNSQYLIRPLLTF